MRAILRAAIVSSLFIANTADAQAIYDAIAFAVGQAGRGSQQCLLLKEARNPVLAARFRNEAEPALRLYLALAATSTNVMAAYKRPWGDAWSIDSVSNHDLKMVHDPWAAKITRLELVGAVAGQEEDGLYGHALWRAYGANNDLLGTYEMLGVRKTSGYALNQLALWSPGHEGHAKPLTPFCGVPGDHEASLAAKAEAEQKKAQRRAQLTKH